MKKKIIASLLATLFIGGFIAIPSNAEWKQNNVGWWYTEGHSWATGWRQINGKWYYFDKQGYMARNTLIDGYYVNSNGEWVSSYAPVTVNNSKFEASTTVKNNNSTTDIGEERAKELVFNHAEVSSNDVSYINVKVDYEFGFKTYEIDFLCKNIEYEYEIDAVTGKILKFNKEIENYKLNTPQNNGTSADIGIEKAKQIALENSGVSSNSIRNLDMEPDYDRGIKIYEINFKVGNIEYEYEINATTGSIEKYDKEYDD